MSISDGTQSGQGGAGGGRGRRWVLSSLKASTIETGTGGGKRREFVPFSGVQGDDPFLSLHLYRSTPDGAPDESDDADEAGQPLAKTYALAPPVPLDALVELYGDSCILPQCGEAVEVNVEGQGFDLVAVRATDDVTTDDVKSAMALEKRRLRAFFRHACRPLSWRETLRRSRRDLEPMGWRGIVVLRLPPKGWQAARPLKSLSVEARKAREDSWAQTDPLGEIVGLEHVPANTLRWCEASDPILATDWLYDEDEATGAKPGEELPDDPGTPRYIPRLAWRRYRLLAHARSGGFSHMASRTAGIESVEGACGFEAVYFREFGDPRIIDSRTGAVLGNYLTGEFPDQGVLDSQTNEPKYAPQWWANEILVDKEYFSIWEPYGRPWWYGVKETDMGLTSAAEANRHGIEDPTIPRVIIAANGTETTAGDIERIDEVAQKNRSGDPSAHFRMMILETKPHVVGDEYAGEARAVLPAMGVHEISSLPDDGLFVDFDEQGRKKIRSARGLSSMSVGLSEDYTFAAAQAAMQVENQRVFDPERDDLDDLVNGTIMVSLRALWWRYQSKRGRIMSPDERTKAIEVAETGGALTPNMHRRLLSETLGDEQVPISEEWGDRPFQMTLAEAKTMGALGLSVAGAGAGAAQDEGGEPGSDTEGIGAEKSAEEAAEGCGPDALSGGSGGGGGTVEDRRLQRILRALRFRLARKAGIVP